MTSAPQSPAPMPPQQSPVPDLSPRSPAGISNVTAAPRGPGVVVPFAAPPRDPDKSRVAVGIVAGITVFVLVCGGALAAAVGVLVWSSSELTTQSVTAADAFLDDIVDEDYGAAYKSLCVQKRKQLDQREFTEDWSETAVVEAQALSVGSDDQGPVVYAEVRLADGATQNIELTVVLEQQNMKMAVCDWEIVQ